MKHTAESKLVYKGIPPNYLSIKLATKTMQKIALSLAVIALINGADAVKIANKATFGFDAPAVEEVKTEEIDASEKRRYGANTKGRGFRTTGQCRDVAPKLDNCGCKPAYKPVYVPVVKPAGQCGPEFCALNDRLDSLLEEKIGGIKESQETTDGLIDQVLTKQDENLGASADISLKLDDVLLKIEDASENVGSVGDSTGCNVEININCNADVDCECECPDITPPGTTDPVDPLCSSEENIAEQGHLYELFQTYPGGQCPGDKEFYLMSPSLNEGVSRFAETYHSMSEEGSFPEEYFNQGVAGVRKGPKALVDYLNWQFRTDVTDLLEDVGGGQLVDPVGNCLGFTEVENYTDRYGATSTRIQVVPCLQPEDIDVTDEAQVEEFKKQVWSVELGESSDELVYVRNACSNDVLQKVRSKGDHDDKVYKGQRSCKEQHFDFALVDKTLCVDDHRFGVNDCLFNIVDNGLFENEEETP